MASEIRRQDSILPLSTTVAVERGLSKESAAHGAHPETGIEEIEVAGESCVTVYGRMQP